MEKTGRHEEDKILWNKQHQDHVLSVEKLYTNRIKGLDRLENELNSQPTSGLTASQLQELIQLVSDEKEARESLQDLASRLTGDLESLKHAQLNSTPASVYSNSTPSSAPAPHSDKTWGTQQYLEAEIRAKQQALDELRASRENCDKVEKELFEARRKIKQQSIDLDRTIHENNLLRQQQQQMAAVKHYQQRGMDVPDNLDFSPQSMHHQRVFSNPTAVPNSNFFNSFGSPVPSTSELSTSQFSASQQFSTRSSRGAIGDAGMEPYESPIYSRSQASGSGHMNPLHHHMSQQQQQLYENQHGRYGYNTSTPPSHIPKVLQSLNNALNGKGHRFVHASLKTPTKCVSCTSILIGFDRQGMYCQDCQVSCHVGCVSKVPTDCPVPMEQRRPDGIDPLKGTGTAYEGVVKTPKPSGVKRGWQTTYVIVCDFKLYLYDCTVDKHGKPTAIEPYIRQVLDMKDPDFRVTNATENDAIHASKSDLPKIFKVAFSQIHDAISCTTNTMGSVNNSDTLGSTGSGSQSNHNGSSNQATGECALVAKQYALLMAESPEEAKKWVIALTELRHLFVRSGLPDKSVFVARELCDITALVMLRTAQCATIIDKSKFVVGFSDHGLMCVELEREMITPVGGEKENNKRNVEKVEYDAEEQLLIVMIGTAKDRHVRIIPTAAMDGRDLKWIKVNDTKNCHLMCWGSSHISRQSPSAIQHYFAIREKTSQIREMAMPGQPQNIRISNGKLFVGYPSSFRMWDLIDNSQTSLVNLEDGSLQFLNQTLHDAEMIISVHGDEDTREFLLVFQRLGIYVDSQGRRCRAQELMFPSKPSAFSYSRPYLCLYTEYQIVVFNVLTAEWIQTVNLKKAKPLHQEGLLVLCYVLDAPHLVLLGSQVQSSDERLYIPQTSQLLSSKGIQKRRRKFSMKTSRDEPTRGDRRSQLPISGPSDFVHVIHMGPGHVVGLQNLIDVRNDAPKSSSSPAAPPSATEKIKQLINPIMRSSSSSSGGAGNAGVHSLRDSSGRPISAHSRNSEGSSLGKDGRTGSNTAAMDTGSGDTYYLEPISNKPGAPLNQSPRLGANTPVAPNSKPSSPAASSVNNTSSTS
uniref:Non-specific serine/threonine protein kinase n=1 Tax=Ditylenchus dipsaci TaxID=166011 RepID=A0A915D2A6_9BILA